MSEKRESVILASQAVEFALKANLERPKETFSKCIEDSKKSLTTYEEKCLIAIRRMRNKVEHDDFSPSTKEARSQVNKIRKIMLRFYKKEFGIDLKTRISGVYLLPIGSPTWKFFIEEAKNYLENDNITEAISKVYGAMISRACDFFPKSSSHNIEMIQNKEFRIMYQFVTELNRRVTFDPEYKPKISEVKEIILEIEKLVEKEY